VTDGPQWVAVDEIQKVTASVATADKLRTQSIRGLSAALVHDPHWRSKWTSDARGKPRRRKVKHSLSNEPDLIESLCYVAFQERLQQQTIYRGKKAETEWTRAVGQNVFHKCWGFAI